MKLIILTSSIFYLLGLKLTHQVEIEQPFTTDTVISAPAEAPQLPKLEKPEEKPQINEDKADTLKSTGSNEKTAPWFPFLEDLETPEL
ncbi:hypothetical protein [Sunxiuqinia rutila]|uniref:hypothetical protein n=1 Tax=Sunxiuqinia rutila TaxID=1397841 RepID=UPI003D36B82D